MIIFGRFIWTGCEPVYDPLPIYVTFDSELRLDIVMDTSSEAVYNMQVGFTAAPRQPVAEGTDLEIVSIAANLGKCDNDVAHNIYCLKSHPFEPQKQGLKYQS